MYVFVICWAPERLMYSKLPQVSNVAKLHILPVSDDSLGFTWM